MSVADPTLHFLADVLLCPISGQKLVVKDTVLHSPSANLEFPTTDGIAWLYRNPDSHLREWRSKVRSVIQYYESMSLRIGQELRKVDLLPLTRKRLEILQEAHLKSITAFSDLLSSLLKEDPKNTPLGDSAARVLHDKIPRQQTVMAYAKTIFRDWVWGESEIQSQLEALRPHFRQASRMLVLGGGACGLPLALHTALKEKFAQLETLVVDINPLLLLTANRLLQNKNLDLIEYPRLPDGLKSVAIEHHVKGKVKPQGFHLVFADAQELQTRKEAFDTLVTPWFIDIVPRDFRSLSRHLSGVLKTGGQWINIGPLAFDRNEQSEIYSTDEIVESLIEAGFEVTAHRLVEMDYLRAPNDLAGRTDNVFVFAATKVKAAKTPARYDYLPEWLRDLKTPIPVTSEIQTLQMRSEVIMQASQLVDGQRSLEDISRLFASHYGMDLGFARDSLQTFFTNVYEQLIFREFN